MRYFLLILALCTVVVMANCRQTRQPFPPAAH